MPNDEPKADAFPLADEIEGLAAKATPGPWEHYEGSIGCYIDPRRDYSDVAFVSLDERGLEPGEGVANAALIVALRNNVTTFTEALRSVAALQAENAKLRGRGEALASSMVAALHSGVDAEVFRFFLAAWKEAR